MAISLGKNLLSIIAQRGMGKAVDRVSQSYERLSSGMRINHASDDPAGLAMLTGLESDARVMSQARRNISDGISLSNMALSAISSMKEIVVRLSELAEQAANGTYTSAQRQALDREADALVSEYNRIVDSTSYNGISLLNPASSNITIQGGYGTIAATSINLTEGLALETGDGTFALGVSQANVGFHNIGDFDGDGIADIVAVFITTIRFGKGLGDGTFSAMTNIGAMGGAQSHDNRLADLNGDGFLDVISGDQNGNIYTRFGDGAGGFLAASTVHSTGFGNVDAVQIADMNQDGELDIVFQEASSGTGVGVLLGVGDGTFLAPLTQAIGIDTGLTVVDFDNDGAMDIATGKAVYLGNNDGTFGAATMSGTEFVLTSGDFNGDGNEDLVTYGTSVSIKLGNGDGTFASNLTIANTTGLNSALNFSSIDRALTADVNGDGFSDLALDFGNSNQMRVYLADGDGSMTISATIATPAGSSLWRFEDVNADGVADVDTIIYGSATNGIALANTSETIHLFGIDLSNQAHAVTSLGRLREQLEAVTLAEGNISAFQSRLSYQHDFVESMETEYRTAASRIKDLDVAEEIADLVRNQILVKATTALVAQANLGSELVLKLLNSEEEG